MPDEVKEIERDLLPTTPYQLKELIFYFLYLGTTGFGGPVALIGYMHRDLVEKKKWFSEDAYKEGLALAQLAPGPLAAQLAIYMGYVHYRIPGATLAGIAFVFPSFLMVLALGYTYVHYAGFPWIQAVFYGVGAAVLGIIAVSSFRLSRKSLGSDRLLWTIFLVLGCTTFIFEKENIWLILLSGLAVWLYRIKPKLPASNSIFFFPFFIQVVTGIWTDSKLFQMAWFFLKAGAFVFGSGLAIVPFLYGGVVKEYQWLNEQQFLDAVAVAMITPGPVVITVGFIGFLVAGFPGACVASMATFLPCYLFTILPAPYFGKYGRHPAIRAIIDGVTAAAIGAIAGAVVVLAKRQFADEISIIIAVAVMIIQLRFKKIREPLIIFFAALAGIIIKRFLDK